MTRRRQQPFWVDKNRKNEVTERLEPVKSAVNHKGSCLFVIDEEGNSCGEPVDNNCHVIPESKVLGELKDPSSGKVLELQWNVGRWGHHFLTSSETNPANLTPDSFEPQLMGTGAACVRWFACREHDLEFQPIDAKHLDFDNPIVPFLCLYRSTLYAADLLRMASDSMNIWDRKAMRGSNSKARIEWVKSTSQIKQLIPRNNRILARLGKAWHIKKAYSDLETDVVSGQLFSFRSQVKFAACVSYSKALTVVVFPYEEDWHKMGVLHLTEDSDSVKKSKEQLSRVVNASGKNSNYGVDVLKELLTNGSGAAAMSPESYRGLSDEEKKTIRRLVARFSGQEAMSRAFGW